MIIPAGPRDDVLDTLESVLSYTDRSRVILVIDDTTSLGTSYHRIRDLSTDVEIIKAPNSPGTQGGLWVKVAAGYRWVLNRCDPRIILRLDADALMLGSGIETAAEEFFSLMPKIGILGSYRLMSDGAVRDFSPAARQLRSETGVRGLLHPRRWSMLRHYVRLAERHGYVYGEHALGGAYIHSYSAATQIYENGWFGLSRLASSKLGEDHIMGLLTTAAGYKIADFGGPGHPMALKWRGLPASPDDLLSDGKLITHSVRSWNDLGERQIREIFVRARRQGNRYIRA